MQRLLLILLLKAVIIFTIIATSYIGLAPDEAQYWTWSQDLDWGYYSKPPGIAWQIWLTTNIFGNNPIGVRFGAIVISFFLSLVVYAVAYGSGLSNRTAFWSAIIMAFCPLGVYLSFAAVTDGGAILFLTAAVAVLVSGMRKEDGPNYGLVGLCIFAGALYKWTAYLFWPFALFFLLFIPSMRRGQIFWGILISLFALLPTLYWNVGHEWATFKHVGTAISDVRSGNLLDFLLAQVGLLSPLFLIFLILGYFYLFKRQEPADKSPLFFLAAFPFAIVIYAGTALFKKMQPNWAAYLYPPGLPLAAWVGVECLRKGKIWLHIGLWIAIFMSVVAFAIPGLQAWSIVPLSYKWNPFRQSVGVEKLKDALQQAGYNPKLDFLLSDKYQTTSLLSFYGEEKKRAYFFNLGDSRKNQFSYWPQMSETERWNTGYFVVIENMDKEKIDWYVSHYKKRLEPYFKGITFEGAFPLFLVGGEPVKYALIFKCIGYLGEMPESSTKY